MKVLLVTPEFPPQFGGIGTHCYEMAKHWSRDIDVTVLAPVEPGAQVRVPLPFRVVGLHSARNRTLRLLRVSRQIRRLAMAESFDVVYVAHWRTSGVALRLATLNLRAPRYVQAIHGGEVLYLLRSRREVISRLLFRWTTSTAAKFVALGRNQVELLDRLGVDRRRVFVSPEGVDVSAFQAPESREVLAQLRRRHHLEGKRILLTLARLAPHKGHDVVIRAMPEILARVPDAAYLIAGSGSREALLRGLADQVGVGEHVHFAGFVAEEELAAYYHLCDAFILPTRELDGDTEGFGIVFLEAAACGKPTIGGRTGGIVEAVLEGETGLLVDPTSTAEIADAAVALLTDERLARRIGEAGRQRVVHELQYKDIAANILEACRPDMAHLAPGAAA